MNHFIFEACLVESVKMAVVMKGAVGALMSIEEAESLAANLRDALSKLETLIEKANDAEYAGRQLNEE